MQLRELEIKKQSQPAMFDGFINLMEPFDYPFNQFEIFATDMVVAHARYLEIAGNCPLNFVNLPVPGIIKAEAISPGLPYDQPISALKRLSPPAERPFHKEPALMRATAYVDVYGQIQMEGTREIDKALFCMIPGIGNCLGIMLKDNNANLTAQHLSTGQQYSADSVYAAIELHQKSFGIGKSSLVALASLGLQKGGLGNFPRAQYPKLAEIDTEVLKTGIRKHFPKTQFAFNIIRNQAEKDGERLLRLQNTNLLSSTFMKAPIVSDQYWFDFREV
jgi:hypothetical protein